MTELPPIDALEPFGWGFTPGPLPADSISREAAIAAALGHPPSLEWDGDVSAERGAFTERGRYRVDAGGRRVTLYSEHPAWIVSITPPPHSEGEAESTSMEWYARHVVVDARTGRRLTAFLFIPEPGAESLLELYEPLDTPEMTADAAVAEAIRGEERYLADLPVTTEYGSRRRLVPGFVQVTDVWRVTFDTSFLPPAEPGGSPDLAWVVIVDDRAEHRWLSAAVTRHDGQRPPSAAASS